MSLIDDPHALAVADPSGMIAAVLALPDHAEAGYAAGVSAGDLPGAEGLRSIVFLGMGGSAVAGDIARALYSSRLGVSLETVRGPQIPGYVQQHTLVVAVSYSGDTAETLAAFDEAIERGARIVAITSGGQIAERARRHGVTTVDVPGGLQPRAALGYLAFTALGVLEAMGLVPPLGSDVSESVRILRAMADELGPDSSTSSNEAKTLASMIGSRAPLIWGTDGLGSTAAMRWKTQFNENGKVPAWFSSMSELDHNEIVGWNGTWGANYFLITLRHDLEAASLRPRFGLTVALARPSGLEQHEVFSQGGSALAQLMSLIYLGDFTSVYLGILRGIDPTPVAVIDQLKQDLA